MIKRRIQEKLLKTIRNFPATGIIGPRQVGKTTLAKMISSLLEVESIYIDLENPRDQIKINDPNLFFEANMDKCIIIDEIQFQPKLFPIIRSMIDMNRKPSRFILLGSSSPVLIRETSESLAGRIAYIELTGLNIGEVYDLNKLWFKGGFPDAFLSTDDELWEQWEENFLKTYIERDLPLLGLNISPIVFRNLWVMLAHSHGSIINYSNISKSLELSSTTIKKYLDFLENAFLIRQLPSFSLNLKKRIVKSPKIFIRDTGMLHHLLFLQNNEALQGHPIKGNSFEGFVIEQILQKTQSKYQASFYRTQNGAECDLILEQANRPKYAIEIKYSSTPKPTKGNFISFEDIGAQQNFIITPDSDEYLVSQDIRVCSLKTFISNYI